MRASPCAGTRYEARAREQVLSPPKYSRRSEDQQYGFRDGVVEKDGVEEGKKKGAWD
jgi:hypothetical protein